MKRSLAATTLAALLCSPAAPAEVYGGAGMLLSEYEYADVSRGRGEKLFLGYHFDEAPVLLELARLDLGEARLDDFSMPPYTFTDSRLGWTGNALSVGWFGGRPGPLAGWLKVGLYAGDSTFDGFINGAPFHAEESSSGICWGLGFEWAFSRHVGLVVDLEGMGSVKTLPGTDEDSTVTLYNLGLVGHFGSVGQPPRKPAPVEPVDPTLPPALPLQP